MKLIFCIALLTSGESYFKQLTPNNQLGLIAGIRRSNTKVSRTSLYEASSPVDGSLSPDIPSNQVILLRESSQTSLHGGQDDEDAKCEIFHAYLQLEYAAWCCDRTSTDNMILAKLLLLTLFQFSLFNFQGSHPNSFVSIDSKQLSKAARDLKSEFSRYKLLRDFLEGMKTVHFTPNISTCSSSINSLTL